jgi:multiple sugar transport system substrate-binding protein
MGKTYAICAVVIVLLGVLGTYLSVTADETSRADDGRTVITFATFQRTIDVQPIVRMFERSRPNVRVKIIAQAYYPKILTMIGAGTPPDVMHIESQAVCSWIARDQYLDLSPYVTADDVADFYPNILAPYRRGEAIYGLPDAFSTVVLYYNQDMFDAAGVRYPDASWDWDIFLEAAKRLTRDDDGDGRIDQYGYVVSGWLNRYSAIIWQNGGQIVNEDFTRCLLDSPETIEAMQWYADLVHKHRVSPTKDQSSEQGEMEMFLAGRAAMFPATNFSPRQYRGMSRFRWDVAPLPRGKVRANTLVGGGNCVLRSTRHSSESAELVKFFSSAELWTQLAEQDNAWGLPPRRSVAEAPVFLHMPGPPANRRAFIDEIPYSRFPDVGPVLHERANLDVTMDEIWYARRSAEDVCRETARRLNEMLAESK